MRAVIQFHTACVLLSRLDNETRETIFRKIKRLGLFLLEEKSNSPSIRPFISV